MRIFVFNKAFMVKMLVLIGIMVENNESVKRINNTLHEYGEYIVGGMPFHM